MSDWGAVCSNKNCMCAFPLKPCLVGLPRTTLPCILPCVSHGGPPARQSHWLVDGSHARRADPHTLPCRAHPRIMFGTYNVQQLFFTDPVVKIPSCGTERSKRLRSAYVYLEALLGRALAKANVAKVDFTRFRVKSPSWVPFLTPFLVLGSPTKIDKTEKEVGRLSLTSQSGGPSSGEVHGTPSGDSW